MSERTYDLIIVGAGPAGLEMGLVAQERGLDFLILEKGAVAAHVREWGFVELFSPWSMNTSELGRKASDTAGVALEKLMTGRELADTYLQPIAETLGDRILPFRTVVGIGREGSYKNRLIGDARRADLRFRLLVEDGKRAEIEFFARSVVDASGAYGRHRWMGPGGTPAVGERRASEHIHYHPIDLTDQAEHWQDQRLLIVGAGYSACTMLEQCQRLADAGTPLTVDWVVSTSPPPVAVADDDPLPYREELGRLANRLATEPPAWMRFHPEATVAKIDRIDEDGNTLAVHLARKGKIDSTIEVGHVFAMIGYVPDRDLYAELQVHECWATSGPMKMAASLLAQSGGDCLTIESGGPELLVNPEPGFFILGAKSYGRNNQFLMQRIQEQVAGVVGHLEQRLQTKTASRD